jgi:hypothetical protein
MERSSSAAKRLPISVFLSTITHLLPLSVPSFSLSPPIVFLPLFPYLRIYFAAGLGGTIYKLPTGACRGTPAAEIICAFSC